MAVTAIDLQVDDVSAAVKLLSNAYGWEVTSDDPGFGELMAGDLRIMLSVERAVAAGAELLLGPLTTDWGTEAA